MDSLAWILLGLFFVCLVGFFFVIVFLFVCLFDRVSPIVSLYRLGFLDAFPTTNTLLLCLLISVHLS